MEMFSLENRDLINEINNGSIEPTSAIDAVVYAKEEELKIVFEELENEKIDELIIFFWNYSEKKPIYVRKTELTDDYLLWKEDVNLRMQMEFMNTSSVRFAIAVKAGDEYCCGYIRNKAAKNEELSYADRLVGKLYSKDNRADIAYWTEGGILSITNIDNKKFDNKFYCATLEGIKWEDNLLIGYMEAPHVDSELNVVMKSVTTKKECEWADIYVRLAGSTGVKNIYRISVDLSAGNSEQEDAYRLDCILDGHEFTIDADEDTLETEEIHTISCADGDFDVIAVHEKNGSFVLQLAEKIYPVMLSVVTAVYNTAPFLAEMINSVLMQKTDRLNKYIIGNETEDYTKRKYQKIFEFILVDDGSTDGSAEILDDYARMSDVIRVIHKENGGVSSARNAGIEVARGRYITFPDSDDKLEENCISECLLFFEKYFEELSVVCHPMRFFDAKTGEHWSNYKFTKENRVIDLSKEPNAVLHTVSSSFMKLKDFEERRFDTSLAIGEDMSMINDIIIHTKGKMGAVGKTCYYYRKRGAGFASAMDNNVNNEKTYLPVMRDVFESILLKAEKEYGFVPKYVQHAVMGQLQWRFATADKGEAAKKTIGEEKFQEYKQLANSLLKYMDDDVIVSQKVIWAEHYYYMLKKKYGRKPELIPKNGDVYFDFNGTTVSCSLGNIYLRLEFLEIRNNVLHLEGYSMDFDASVKFLVYVNGEETAYQTVERDANKYTFDDVVMHATTFSVDIPLNRECESYIVEFHSRLDDLEVEKKQFRYAKTMPLSQSYSKSYYSNEGWIVRKEQNKFHVYNMTYQSAATIDFENEFETQIEKSKNKDALKDILSLRRQALSILANRQASHKIWLISDRIAAANDNGEALFRYLSQKNDNDVEAYYVIDKESKDFERMQEFGRVVAYGSRQHQLLHMIADYVISSAGDEFVVNMWYQNHIKEEALRDFLARKQFIFLQHGITKDDISGWLNRYNKNIRGFICAAPQEAQSILDYEYYYQDKNVWLTGFPRHDRLHHDEKRYITIMPTWRHWLADDDHGTKFKELFVQSEYFEFYNKLINDKRLLSAAEKYGYTICYMPHPRVQQVIDLFAQDSRVKFFTSEKPYNEIYAESDLVMTDYSSACIDFALLRKPIVYCQFDKDYFFENHIYKKGYFDYERDGFGEVTYDMDTLIDTMITYMENGCQVHEPYGSRMDKFFAYHDYNNCERVYQKIKELG